MVDPFGDQDYFNILHSHPTHCSTSLTYSLQEFSIVLNLKHCFYLNYCLLVGVIVQVEVKAKEPIFYAEENETATSSLLVEDYHIVSY